MCMFQGGQCGRLVLEMSRGLVEYFMSFNTEADDSFMVISAMRNGMSYTRWLASFFLLSFIFLFVNVAVILQCCV